jgi:hypothetical protein
VKGEIGEHEPGRGMKTAAKTIGFLYSGYRKKINGRAKKIAALPEKRKGENELW